MYSKIGFEMSLIVVGAIRERCASFMILTATVSKIFGGQTSSSILVVGLYISGLNACISIIIQLQLICFYLCQIQTQFN